MIKIGKEAACKSACVYEKYHCTRHIGVQPLSNPGTWAGDTFLHWPHKYSTASRTIKNQRLCFLDVSTPRQAQTDMLAPPSEYTVFMSWQQHYPPTQKTFKLPTGWLFESAVTDAKRCMLSLPISVWSHAGQSDTMRLCDCCWRGLSTRLGTAAISTTLELMEKHLYLNLRGW